MEVAPTPPHAKMLFPGLVAGLGLALLAILAVSLLRMRPVDAPSVLTEAGRTVASANGEFAVALYQQVATDSAGTNIFLSPYSIATSLAVAAEGAVGQTRDQMINALQIPHDSVEHIHVGQREIRDSLVPQLPPELVARLTDLRTRLQTANDRTTSLAESEVERNLIYKSMREAHALAKEINALNKGVSTYELNVANSLWMEQSYPYDRVFLSAIEPTYGKILFHSNFRKQPEAAREAINQWVDQSTDHQVQNILPPKSISDATKLLIINAVRFKGAWAEPFREESTKIGPFRISEDSDVDVSMMHQWNDSTASYAAFTKTGDLFLSPQEVREDLRDEDPTLYPDQDGFQMLALDYQGERLQMILLLPQSTTGLARLEAILSYELLQTWILRMERRTVNLSVPKFKLNTSYSLEAALSSLGMSKAFGNEAQFDRLTTLGQIRDQLRIDRVIHQASVDINEVGTEAAAATIIDFPTIGDFEPEMRPFVPFFKADRPFLFLIRDRHTSTILFLGRLCKPVVDSGNELLAP